MNAKTALLALAAFAVTPTLAQAQDYGKDIVETAVEAGSFNTLAAALSAAGLVETLKGEGPFTVFAPTDEAFAALPAGTVDKLLMPENKDALIAVLTYHVVSGNVDAAAVVKLDAAETVNGQSVTVMAHGGDVMINDATVVAADVSASNGIIHVIDKVLLPAGLELSEGAEHR